VVSFVAAQRAEHGIPHALSRALGVSESSVLQVAGAATDAPRTVPRCTRRRREKGVFDGSDGDYGSSRVLVELRQGGWKVCKKSGEA
jgi:hypothetical protein